MSEPLTWESTYALALALHQAHPKADLNDITLGRIYAWVLALEGFDDDPALANDEILSAIYQDWFEETL